ncbi:hypothetical protein [Rugamonas sp.]|uniref:hypothetical protein n=1 Tax=Rugamonas sp. TaxID=1926287 RepID=UPI0025DE9047|nr:hypothetical protein [Rugamonas sp.]
MTWTPFPHPDPAYVHTPASLLAAWPQLHLGDTEAWPADARLVQAWIAFHAGQFERAARLGLDVGVEGYAVAHKATCIHALFLETSEKTRCAVYEEVAERCERQQLERPANPAGFYWHGYALGRYALGISVVKALAQGLGAKVRHSLDAALTLAPQHADAHIALGAYHAEVIDKVGAMIGGLTYRVKKDACYGHFETALGLDPASAVGRVAYARALLMLDGKRQLARVLELYRQAAGGAARDATERLVVEEARLELNELEKQ